MRKSIQSFVHENKGAISTLFTVLSVPILVAVGTALDTAQAIRIQGQLQSLADKTAIAGARLPATSDENRLAAAEGIYQGNLAEIGLENVAYEINAANSEVRVTTRYDYQTAVMKIVGIPTVPLEATAAARPKIQNGGVACILALNETTDDAFHLQGINDSNSENCWVWVNSTSPQAISADGAATATAQGFCTQGGVAGGDHFGPRPHSGCSRLEDPFYDKFSSYQPPRPGCDHENLNLKNGTYTLSPGVYCGNTTLKPHAHVTLLPGVYVMEHGALDVQAGASLTGDGVTIFFWGFNTSLSIRGGASVDLKAPSTGELAGFVLVDRKFDWYNPEIYETVIQGGGTIKLQGIVYAPQWRINISGNGELNQDSRCFAMVADHFYMEGNGIMNVVSDCDTAGLPNLMPKIKSGPAMLE